MTAKPTAATGVRIDPCRGRQDQPDSAEQLHNADEPHRALEKSRVHGNRSTSFSFGWVAFISPAMANMAARIA